MNSVDIERFKRTRRTNYKGSFVAMVLCQILLFDLDLGFTANVVAYIVNLVGWIIIGALLECVLAIKYGIDLSKMRIKK